MRFPLAFLVALLLAAPASAATLSGRVKGDRTLLSVEAVALKTGVVEAVDKPAKGRYSMKVPKGPYIVVARSRTRARSSRGVKATHHGLTVKLGKAAAVSGGGAIGVGKIPILDPDGGTGRAEGMIINGLQPACEAKKRKLVDRTSSTLDDLRGESRLSQEGRSDLRYDYTPTEPTITVRGEVTIDENGRPRADIEIVDVKTGDVIRHVVVAGDNGDAEDLYKFLRGLGNGVGEIACDKKPATVPSPLSTPAPPAGPTPGPTSTPPPGKDTLTMRYAGTYSYEYKATSPSGSNAQKDDLTWDGTATLDVATGTITDSAWSASGHREATSTGSGQENSYSCTVSAIQPPDDFGWFLQANGDKNNGYFNIPRSIGHQVSVSGSSSCPFSGSAMLCDTNCRSACLNWPDDDMSKAYEEAIGGGRTGVVGSETTHHGVTGQTLSGQCSDAQVDAKRTISADLTITRSKGP